MHGETSPNSKKVSMNEETCTSCANTYISRAANIAATHSANIISNRLPTNIFLLCPSSKIKGFKKTFRERKKPSDRGGAGGEPSEQVPNERWFSDDLENKRH